MARRLSILVVALAGCSAGEAARGSAPSTPTEAHTPVGAAAATGASAATGRAVTGMPAQTNGASGGDAGAAGVVEAEAAAGAGATDAGTAARAEEPAPIPPRTAVLHIGDSFTLAGFAQGLRPHMLAVKARYEVKSEQSSYTTSWAPKLERIVADTQPDLVIITLGANEVANVNPVAHAPAVRRIAQIVGNRPCVWVSPPLWRKDTGIIDVLRESSAPCRFFDTDELVKQPIARQGDKIHPSAEGGAVWAEAFWAWLETQRLPASATAAEGGKRKPWALKPAPAEEHRPRGAPEAKAP